MAIRPLGAGVAGGAGAAFLLDLVREAAHVAPELSRLLPVAEAVCECASSDSAFARWIERTFASAPSLLPPVVLGVLSCLAFVPGRLSVGAPRFPRPPRQ